MHPFGAGQMYDTDKYALYRETVVIINPFGDGRIYDKICCAGKIMLILLSYLSKSGTSSQMYDRIMSFHCKTMPTYFGNALRTISKMVFLH